MPTTLRRKYRKKSPAPKELEKHRLPNIIEAIKDPNLFRTFLEDRRGKISTWKNWLTALRVLYGLGLKESEFELVRQCTGRDPIKLPEDGFRTALFLCGRRSGKSRCISIVASYEACLAGNEGKLARGEMGMVAVVSPSKKQSRVIKNYVRGIFTTPYLQEEMVGEGDKEGFDISSGIRIEILAGDWKTVRSFTTLAVIVDEVCFFGMDEESNVKSDTELIRALDPGRATTGGKLVAISTPYAEKGWAYNTWKKNFGNDKGNILVWRAPSQLMNPTLPDHIIQEALEEDEFGARAEYLAEWRTDVCTWLSRQSIEDCVVDGRMQIDYQEGTRYYCFVDISGGRSDDSAIAIAHNEHDKAVVDLEKRYKAPHSPRAVIQQMKTDVLDTYKIRRVTGDNYGADFVKTAFEEMGVRYIKSEKIKSGLYLELLPKITSHQCELLDDDILITQLASLERRTRSGGRDSVDHPPGHKDDLANAVAGVITLASTPRIKVGAL